MGIDATLSPKLDSSDPWFEFGWAFSIYCGHQLIEPLKDKGWVTAKVNTALEICERKLFGGRTCCKVMSLNGGL